MHAWDSGVWIPHVEDQLIFATTGEEALELVQQHRPALFMSDEYHPGNLGGIALFEALRDEPNMTRGYFTACSLESPSTDLADAARELGVEFLMEKPTALPEFFERLAPLLEKHRSNPPHAPCGRVPQFAARVLE